MVIKWKELIISILIPLGVGGLSALMTGGAMSDYMLLKGPPLSPPAWVFPVVWTLLYILMGIASYLVRKENNIKRDFALKIYGVQLFFNLFWSYIFFSLENYLFAFVWLITLWVLIIITTVLFYRINKTAGCLMIPYILWVTFAAYLNLAIYILN